MVKLSGTKRGFWSKSWVTEPGRTSETLLMPAASAADSNVLPYLTVDGAEAIWAGCP